MLVDYSSDSDSDTPSTVLAPGPPAAAQHLHTKPKSSSLIQKDSSTGARKVVVQLPDALVVDGELGPPKKRPRFGGGPGSSGLSALLPAPKRSGAGKPPPPSPSASAISGFVVGRVLGGGAARKEDENLVAMPSSGGSGSRVDHDEEGEAEGETTADVSNEKRGAVASFSSLPSKEQVEGEDMEKKAVSKPSIGTTTQFVPQSVSRKPIQPASSFKRKPKTRSPAQSTAATSSSPKSEPSRVSLFGSALESTTPTASLRSNQLPSKPLEYKPLLVTTAARAPLECTTDESHHGHENIVSDDPSYDSTYHTPNSGSQSQPKSSQLQDLDSIARSIGLDDAALRQLRGRKSRNGPINIVDFNVEQEYNLNEQNRALGLTIPQANPLRSIAPGRHQLTSLLNAAQSQRSALEEHFAQGKRNKKEAGSKYGW